MIPNNKKTKKEVICFSCDGTGFKEKGVDIERETHDDLIPIKIDVCEICNGCGILKIVK
jgi:RecJ-like exonuclease